MKALKNNRKGVAMIYALMLTVILTTMVTVLCVVTIGYSDSTRAMRTRSLQRTRLDAFASYLYDESTVLPGNDGDTVDGINTKTYYIEFNYTDSTFTLSASDFATAQEKHVYYVIAIITGRVANTAEYAIAPHSTLNSSLSAGAMPTWGLEFAICNNSGERSVTSYVYNEG
ncbi:MAG: hypothetical protein PHX51_03480 [Clostridia bacterium]|nr:hypothetical protein [Clostridia bacterium]